MQIVVKSVKVLKSGNNQYGDWKLVKVYTVEGVEYTTLAEEADQIPGGATLNITDMDEDDKGKKKFKKFEIITAGPAAPAPGGKLDEMTNAMWDEKQRLERASIESQTRAERITELLIAGKVEWGDSLGEKLRAWLDKLGGAPVARVGTKAKVEATADQDFEQLGREPGNGAPPLKNAGELMSRAAKFGISSRDVLEANGVGKADEISDLDAAWSATAAKFEGTIKAHQEANK